MLQEGSFMIYTFRKIFLAFSDTLKLSWKEYALVCVFFFCLLLGQEASGTAHGMQLYVYDYGFFIPCIRIYLNTNLLHLNFIDCLCQPNVGIDWLPQYFFLFTFAFYLVFSFIRRSIVSFFAEFSRHYHKSKS